MLDLTGVELTAEEREILRHPLVGGVILFTRNFVDPAQLAELVRAIHALRSPALLVAVDHEGGRVQRFRTGFSRLPALRLLGELHDRQPARALQLAEDLGWLMAVELRAVSVDFSFAPVVDLNHGVSEVIGDRALHRTPEVVFALAYAYMKGMHSAGMAATAKHFPGHGAVVADSHVAIAHDNRDFDTLWNHDIVPFRRLIDNRLAAIMPAHVIYDQVDSAPAGFSKRWLQAILRDQLHFHGVIFSDDLNMQGASVAGEVYSSRARAAFEAGCDMAVICNNRAGALQILDHLDSTVNPVARTRLARMHGQHQYRFNELHYLPRWTQARQNLQQLNENFLLS